MGPPMTRRRRPGAAQGPIMIEKKHSCYYFPRFSVTSMIPDADYLAFLYLRRSGIVTPLPHPSFRHPRERGGTKPLRLDNRP